MSGSWVITAFIVTLATFPVFGEFLLPEDTKFNDGPVKGASERGDLGQQEGGPFMVGDEDNPYFTFDWGFGDDDDYSEEIYDETEEDYEEEDGDEEEEEEEEEDYDGEDDVIYDESTGDEDESEESEEEEIEEIEREIKEAEEEDEFRMNRQWLQHTKRMRENNGRWRRMMQRALHGQVDLNPYLNVNWDLRFLTENNKWWNGPNVCKRTEEDEEEIEEDTSIIRHHMISSSVCDDTGTVYKCTTEVKMLTKKKKMSVIYECCHGFQRQGNEQGCSKELPMRTLMETLEHLEAADLVQAINGISLTDFMDSGNFTIFAPKQGIFGEFTPVKDMDTSSVIIVTPELMELAKELEETVMAHIAPGHIKTAYIEDEQLLPTLSQGNAIRMNIYERPKMLVTANCRPVVSSDNLATNGVVHLVDGILSPVKESIASIVSKNPDLSMFKTVLGQSGLLSLLKKDGQYTLMAPSNSAFNRMNPDIRHKLLSGEQCVRDVIRHHLLPNVICSGILDGRLTTVNILNRKLSLSRTDEDKLFVDDAQVLETDVMATNGVIHIIDDVLIPDEALTLLQVADKMDAKTFLSLVGVSGLTKKLTQLHNFTLFMPTAEAFEKVTADENQTLLDDPEMLANTLLYHVLPSTEYNTDLEHKTKHNTLLNERNISVRNFKNFPLGLLSQKTIECAVISKTDVGVCGGVIHMIDRVMTPPGGDVYDILQDSPELSELVRLMKAAGVADTIQNQDTYTVFAPTNKALTALGEETLKFLGEHPDKLRGLLLHHITPDAVCCSGIFDDILSETRTTLDKSVVLTRRQGNRPLVNQVPIATCDVMATNGIVHVIDRVLPEAVNKYVTRHMRHDGKMNWHIHHTGDNFGRGLEDYVKNILDVWFGPKTSRPRVDSRLGRVQNQAGGNNWKAHRPVQSNFRHVQNQNLEGLRRRLQLRGKPSVTQYRRTNLDNKPKRTVAKVASILRDNYGLPHDLRRHSVMSHGVRRHRGHQDPGFVKRRLQLAQNRRQAHNSRRHTNNVGI